MQSFLGETNRAADQANLAKISNDTDKLLLSLQGTVGKLEHMLSELNESSVNTTLGNLQRSTEELEEAINQFKQYPSGAFFGKPPPHAKSVEPPRQHH